MQKLGVFWKIQDICYQICTEIFKIEEEMTEKMKPKVFPLNDIFLGHSVDAGCINIKKVCTSFDQVVVGWLGDSAEVRR